VVSLQTCIQFPTLRFGEFDRLGQVRDRVPQVFHELEPFRQRKIEQVIGGDWR
jgi:hypothetical protein